jgi:thioesterase domain-containing protein
MVNETRIDKRNVHNTEYYIRYQFLKGQLQSFKNYRMQSYSGKMVLFKAMEDEPIEGFANAADFRWDQWALGGLDVYPVPGSHGSMIYLPYVQVLAEKIKSLLLT